MTSKHWNFSPCKWQKYVVLTTQWPCSSWWRIRKARRILCWQYVHFPVRCRCTTIYFGTEGHTALSCKTGKVELASTKWTDQLVYSFYTHNHVCNHFLLSWQRRALVLFASAVSFTFTYIEFQKSDGVEEKQKCACIYVQLRVISQKVPLETTSCELIQLMKMSEQITIRWKKKRIKHARMCALTTTFLSRIGGNEQFLAVFGEGSTSVSDHAYRLCTR